MLHEDVQTPHQIQRVLILMFSLFSRDWCCSSSSEGNHPVGSTARQPSFDRKSAPYRQWDPSRHPGRAMVRLARVRQVPRSRRVVWGWAKYWHGWRSFMRCMYSRSGDGSTCPICGTDYDQRIIIERGEQWSDLYPGTPFDFFTTYQRRCTAPYDAEQPSARATSKRVIYFHKNPP